MTALVDELLHRSSFRPSPLTKVIGLVNRALKREDSFWGADGEAGGGGAPELELVSGVDLTGAEEGIEKVLRERAEGVRWVFYFAFKEVPGDAEEEVRTNVDVMRCVVRVVKRISPVFEVLVYPGGTRGHGIYRPGGMFSAPLTEDMAATLPEDYARTVAYPHYRAMLVKESAGQSWLWCELCPDAIIGFTLNGSGSRLRGIGRWAEVPFPGTREGYEALYTETSTRVLARVAMFAALHPDMFREKVLNVADSETPGRMRERWPEIAAWFGLKGVPPLETASVQDPKPSDFIREHGEKLKEAGTKGVQIWNAKQLDSYGYWLTFDRHLSLDRLRGAGFREDRSPQEGWEEAFEIVRKAGMIG